MITSRSAVLGIRMFQTKTTEKTETHFMLNNFFFENFFLLWDNVGKYCSAEQATVDNMAYAHFMLVT